MDNDFGRCFFVLQNCHKIWNIEIIIIHLVNSGLNLRPQTNTLIFWYNEAFWILSNISLFREIQTVEQLLWKLAYSYLLEFASFLSFEEKLQRKDFKVVSLIGFAVLYHYSSSRHTTLCFSSSSNKWMLLKL